MKKLLPVALLVVAGTVAACSSDEKTGPTTPADAAACIVGTITPGATREFTLNGATGCGTLDIWRGDSVRAVSHSVRLDANRLYTFRAVEKNASINSSFDLTMALFGPGADTTEYGWLAGSDDNWGGTSGYAPIIYYVPKVSGTYAVRVAGYSGNDTASTVELSSRSCPLGATIVGATTPSTTNGSIAADGCVASNNMLGLDSGIDSTRIALLRITLPADAGRRITVVSSAFHPSIRVVGPGADLWGTGANSQSGYLSEGTRASGDTASVVFRTDAFKVVVDTATADFGQPLLRATARAAKRVR